MMRTDEDYSKSSDLEVQIAARAGSKAARVELQRRHESGTVSLSTPIVSVQDGPRMSGNLSNFKGKKAAPFKKGGGRRTKVAVAKALAKKARQAK